jgi:hypothetical protein
MLEPRDFNLGSAAAATTTTTTTAPKDSQNSHIHAAASQNLSQQERHKVCRELFPTMQVLGRIFHVVSRTTSTTKKGDSNHPPPPAASEEDFCPLAASEILPYRTKFRKRTRRVRDGGANADGASLPPTRQESVDDDDATTTSSSTATTQTSA